MSTLPPTPSYNPNIPIVSSAGGGPAAYKDPSSPESIMKKTSTLDAQSTVDSRYDVKEGFLAMKKEHTRLGGASLIVFVLIILSIVVLYKFFKFPLKVFLVILAAVLLIVSISIYKNV